MNTEDFWTNYTEADTGCWIWQGPTNSRGYGRILIDGKRQQAHRVAWSLAHGRPVPDGLNVCHRCNTTLCIRPDHLYAGTQSQNVLDSVRAGTHRDARKTECIAGHKFTPDNTVWRQRKDRVNPTRVCKVCVRRRGREGMNRYRDRQKEAA